MDYLPLDASDLVRIRYSAAGIVLSPAAMAEAIEHRSDARADFIGTIPAIPATEDLVYHVFEIANVDAAFALDARGTLEDKTLRIPNSAPSAPRPNLRWLLVIPDDPPISTRRAFDLPAEDRFLVMVLALGPSGAYVIAGAKFSRIDESISPEEALSIGRRVAEMLSPGVRQPIDLDDQLEDYVRDIERQVLLSKQQQSVMVRLLLDCTDDQFLEALSRVVPFVARTNRWIHSHPELGPRLQQLSRAYAVPLYKMPWRVDGVRILPTPFEPVLVIETGGRWRKTTTARLSEAGTIVPWR